jgi:hypothetical protein
MVLHDHPALDAAIHDAAAHRVAMKNIQRLV